MKAEVLFKVKIEKFREECAKESKKYIDGLYNDKYLEDEHSRAIIYSSCIIAEAIRNELDEVS